MYKYLIFDLDGTLLDSQKKINENNIEMINRLSKNGVSIIIASGRHFYELIQYMNLFAPNTIDYIISSDGLYVYDGIKRLVWNSECLIKQDIEIIKKSIKSDTRLFLVSNNKNYFLVDSFLKKNVLQIIQLIKKNKDLAVINNLREYEELKCEKIKINKSDLNESELKSLRRQYNVNLIGNNYEILNKNVCKYNALVFLDKKKYIDLNDSLYFGDDYNDKECFKYIRHCVAMGSSPQEIKKMAEFVTDDSDNNGVGKFLANLYKII